MIGDFTLPNNNLLSEIKSPDDIKNLSFDKLRELCAEIRNVLIETVSNNGGHLSSNLGVVELSVALHKVFNSPKDKIIWDVGHQVYTHKILTGRCEQFSTLRTEGGISGFSSPEESEHDIFYSGHSSTSVSSAFGIAMANRINGKKDYTIAVIGDGALTGGLAYEALNNAGRSKARLIVILNDNKMSISENVGGVARYLAVIRSKPEYFRLKAKTESTITKIPLIGRPLAKQIFDLKTRIKNRMYKSTFFEDMGFRYMGPIDGHNLEQLSEALDSAKLVNGPVLLHINTIKGKGYDFAEKSPSEFHGISKFNIDNGETNIGSDNFSSVFGSTICELAEKDKRVCAVTAAMALGTGLKDFSKKYPERFFDVGIAEEHAITFTAGLSKGGMKPVVALYSTFLQRSFDQLIHDCSLQNANMIIAVDRAGFVGEDGVTHQGLFDVPMLLAVPNIKIYSPFTFKRMKYDFESAVKQDGLFAIRYPRGNDADLPKGYEISENDFDFFNENGAALIVTYGRISAETMFAVEKLKSENKIVSLLVLNCIKPIPKEVFNIALTYRKIVFYEESEKAGSVGTAFAEILAEKGYNGKFEHIAVNDEFVHHASVPALLKKFGLDRDSIYNKFSEKLNG